MFKFYVICTFNRKQKVLSSCQFIIIGNMTCVSRLLDSHSSEKCSPFCFLNLFWLATRSYFLLFISTKADLFLYFQVKCFGFFVVIQPVCFCLVNFKCGAYLAVDHSLVYIATLKYFYYLSVKFLYNFLIHILDSFSIYFLILHLGSCRTGILSSTLTNLQICFCIFDSE